jgi:hypothetical protein
MTDLTSPDDVQRLIDETIRAERGRSPEPSPTTTEAPPKTEGPPKGAAPLNLSDPQIAIQLLTAETNDRQKAIETLALEPQAVGAMKDAIAKRRAELQREADEAAIAEWMQTPAGRRHTADEALKAKQEKQHALAQARALLDNDPQLAGIDLDTLTDDELLDAAGVLDKPEPKPNPYALTEKERAIVELKSRWFTLAKYERQNAMHELGLTDAEQLALLEQAKTATHPTAW